MASTKHERRPVLACEIAADRVLAGRASDHGRMVETSAARELAPGTVVPDLTETNLRDGAALRQAIESALGSVGARSRDVIAVLPDTAVRVVLLDFQTLPAKPDEAEAVVRFRLKKSLPFDLDEARIVGPCFDFLACDCCIVDRDADRLEGPRRRMDLGAAAAAQGLLDELR